MVLGLDGVFYLSTINGVNMPKNKTLTKQEKAFDNLCDFTDGETHKLIDTISQREDFRQSETNIGFQTRVIISACVGRLLRDGHSAEFVKSDLIKVLHEELEMQHDWAKDQLDEFKALTLNKSLN